MGWLRRANALDCFLILLLVGTLLSALFRGADIRETAEGEHAEAVVITLAAKESYLAVAECLEIGEMLYTESGEAWGELVALRSFPITEKGESDAGYLRCRLEADVLLRGRMRGALFLREGREALAVGSSHLLFGARAMLHGELLFLQRSGKETPETPLSDKTLYLFCTKS